MGFHRMIYRVVTLSALAALLASQACAEQVQSVSQYGITWTFDRPCEVGKFITGDYWVVGPVTVTHVTPAPGPSTGKPTGTVKSIYGATALVDDSRMRNGSMIVLNVDSGQGYDSRPVNYKPELSVKFPCNLAVNQSLISSISNETFPSPVLHAELMWTQEKKNSMALKSAAILTCLDKAPPSDAFRPPYAGSEKPIYGTKNIHWDLLPKLAPEGTVPPWSQFERYFERPWLDHIASWIYQNTMPLDNQPAYGREWNRITAIASLMLMLDVPQTQKEKLMIGMIQLGIDTKALARLGRDWQGDGAHYGGRKWPILFAGLMLDDKDLQSLPPATIFEEDQQTYYGKGYAGQTVLYQMCWHTFVHQPYEEKSPDTWTADDKKSEAYRMVGSKAWPGIALSAELLKARELWNHEAFFDYCDREMSKDDAYAAKRGAKPRPTWEGSSFDPFVDAMWAAYRKKIPEQPGGAENLKWVWDAGGKTGKYVSNSKN